MASNIAWIDQLDQVVMPAYVSRTMPRTINLYAAKTQLSALVDAAERGEEIIIAKNGVGKARLTAIRKPRRDRRKSGLMTIRSIAEDFDATDESIIKDFESAV